MICVLVAGKTTAFAAATFTLAWTHSIEKTRWAEDWTVTPAGLQIIQARAKGSGAGMEPADNAVLEGGWWTWRPDLGPQERLVLAASAATGEGWTFCAEGRCALLGERPGDPAVVMPCGMHDE